MENSHNLLEGKALKLFFEGTDFYDLEPRVAPAAVDHVWKYEGDNNKYFLMVFEHPGKSPVDDAWKAMVHGMIENAKAMNMSLRDFAFVNLHHNQGVSFAAMKQFFSPAKMIFWGCNVVPLGLQLQPYELHQVESTKILLVEKPENYLAAPELKNKLWVHIKKYFLT